MSESWKVIFLDIFLGQKGQEKLLGWKKKVVVLKGGDGWLRDWSVKYWGIQRIILYLLSHFGYDQVWNSIPGLWYCLKILDPSTSCWCLTYILKSTCFTKFWGPQCCGCLMKARVEDAVLDLRLKTMLSPHICRLYVPIILYMPYIFLHIIHRVYHAYIYIYIYTVCTRIQIYLSKEKQYTLPENKTHCTSHDCPPVPPSTQYKPIQQCAATVIDLPMGHHHLPTIDALKPFATQTNIFMIKDFAWFCERNCFASFLEVNLDQRFL